MFEKGACYKQLCRGTDLFVVAWRCCCRCLRVCFFDKGYISKKFLLWSMPRPCQKTELLGPALVDAPMFLCIFSVLAISRMNSRCLTGLLIMWHVTLACSDTDMRHGSMLEQKYLKRRNCGVTWPNAFIQNRTFLRIFVQPNLKYLKYTRLPAFLEPKNCTIFTRPCTPSQLLVTTSTNWLMDDRRFFDSHVARNLGVRWEKGFVISGVYRAYNSYWQIQVSMFPSGWMSDGNAWLWECGLKTHQDVHRFFKIVSALVASPGDPLSLQILLHLISRLLR